MTTIHKSAITDHVVEHNHKIGLKKGTVIGTEQNRYKRWIKEAIKISKRWDATTNLDEGLYQLTLVFDELLEKNP